MTCKLLVFIVTGALAVTAAAAEPVVFRDTAVLSESNGYRYETTFRTEEAFRITVTLEPRTAPCEALLYPQDKDTAMNSASGRGVLYLSSSRGGRFTLAVVGGSRKTVKVTILARTNTG